MIKEVNDYMNKAVRMLGEFKPESFISVLRIQSSLSENTELYRLAGRLTGSLFPEYLDMLPSTKTQIEEYETYLEFLRQSMLEEGV